MKNSMRSLLFAFTAILSLAFVSCKQATSDTPTPETQTPTTPVVTQGLNVAINTPVTSFNGHPLNTVEITIIPYTGAAVFDATTAVFKKTIPLAEMTGSFKIDLPVGQYSVKAASYFRVDANDPGKGISNYLGNYGTNFKVKDGIYISVEINPGTVTNLLVWK